VTLSFHRVRRVQTSLNSETFLSQQFWRAIQSTKPKLENERAGVVSEEDRDPKPIERSTFEKPTGVFFG